MLLSMLTILASPAAAAPGNSQSAQPASSQDGDATPVVDDDAADDGDDDGAADGDDDEAVSDLPSTGQGSDGGASGSAIVLFFGAISMVALAAGFAWRQRHTI